MFVSGFVNKRERKLCNIVSYFSTINLLLILSKLTLAGFVMREKVDTCPSPSAIKVALCNKLSAMESRKSRNN